MRLIFIRRKVIGMNKIQDELELVFPTPEYKTQVEEYLQEFLIMESMKLQEMVD